MGKGSTMAQENIRRKYVSENLGGFQIHKDRRRQGIPEKIALREASKGYGHQGEKKDEYEIKGLTRWEPGYEFKRE